MNLNNRNLFLLINSDTNSSSNQLENWQSKEIRDTSNSLLLSLINYIVKTHEIAGTYAKDQIIMCFLYLAFAYTSDYLKSHGCHLPICIIKLLHTHTQEPKAQISSYS